MKNLRDKVIRTLIVCLIIIVTTFICTAIAGLFLSSEYTNVLTYILLAIVFFAATAAFTD